jgi:hypothetical protein
VLLLTFLNGRSIHIAVSVHEQKIEDFLNWRSDGSFVSEHATLLQMVEHALSFLPAVLRYKDSGLCSLRT